jgi:phospholipid-binding lipoprotein MlaA
MKDTRRIRTQRSYTVVFIICLVLVFPGSQARAQDGSTDFLSDEFYEKGLESKEYQLDRLEPVNRAVFAFNDRMYIYVLEPIATAYSYFVPRDLRVCIYNFFRNLEEPVRFVNSLLQGRVGDAGNVLMRFLLNSTVGIYGLADAADRVFDYPPVEATLGETLGKWGVGDGSYLVVPLYGPSTIRDFGGSLVDGLALTPYYYWTDDVYVMGGTYMGKETNKISMHLGEYEELKEVFFDPYVGFRNAYFQHRSRLRDTVEQEEEKD